MVLDLSRLVFPLLILGMALILSFPLGAFLTRTLSLAELYREKKDVSPEAKTEKSGPERRRGTRLDVRHIRQFLAFETLPAQTPRSYVASVFSVAVVAIVLTTLCLEFQYLLPWNPDRRGPVDASLAFHAAVASLTASGNPHVRGSEELSYLSLILTGGWLHLLSAALGLSCVAALTRLLSGARVVGNLYQDLARLFFYFLLPASFLIGLALIFFGVPMTFTGQIFGFSVDGSTQQIAVGPVAFVVAARALAAAGGGFFFAGAAHPFETPSVGTAAFLMTLSLALPFAALHMFGRALGAAKQKRMWMGVGFVFLIFQGVLQLGFAHDLVPLLSQLDRGVPFADTLLEGTELRFSGWVNETWTTIAAITGSGGQLSSLDSAHPLATLGALIGMCGFPGFSGSGSGILRLFLFVVLTSYLAGTMTGRTSSWHGYRLGARELRYAVLGLLLPFLCMLLGTGIFANTTLGHSTVSELGHHGLSQLLVEFSASAFQGSLTMEGLTDNTFSWNVATSAVALLCRFGTVAACFGLAASLTARQRLGNPNMLVRSDNWRFGVLLSLVIAGTGILLAFPLAVLGPIGETLELLQRGLR